MVGTATDITAPRPGGPSSVFAVFGRVAGAARSLNDLYLAGAVVRQISQETLLKTESASPTLRAEGRLEVENLVDRPYVGAFSLDEYWNNALEVLSPASLLRTARRVVQNKGNLYSTAEKADVPVPPHIIVPSEASGIGRGLQEVSNDLILKPTTGGGSRGVYRYRHDLSLAENVDIYLRRRRAVAIPDGDYTICMSFRHGIEVSVDGEVFEGQLASLTVHEKPARLDGQPFVDRVMTSPPESAQVRDNEALLGDHCLSLLRTLDVEVGTFHAEFIIGVDRCELIDFGVRPGAGLIPHSVEVHTGVDPRVTHLLASVGVVPTAHRQIAIPTTTAIACAYVKDRTVQLVNHVSLIRVAQAMAESQHVFAWHLNSSVIDDQIYHPDAGLSIGIKGSTQAEVLKELDATIDAIGFTTN